MTAARSTRSLNPELDDYLAAREQELDQISVERRARLEELAALVRDSRARRLTPRLLFVCTHNSRRSQLAQAWAAAAAARVGVVVESYSAGTEATAFDVRAVGALRRAGFAIGTDGAAGNPTYTVTVHTDALPLRCSSKRIEDALPAGRSFVAVMVCGQADAACPFVPGAEARVALTYEDPKQADGTPDEARVYDERCAEIAREMLEVFRLARSAPAVRKST